AARRAGEDDGDAVVVVQRGQPRAVLLQQPVDRPVGRGRAGVGRARVGGVRLRAEGRDARGAADAVGAAHDHLEEGGCDLVPGAGVVAQFGVAPGALARPLLVVDAVRGDVRPGDLLGLVVQVHLVDVAEVEGRIDVDAAVGAGDGRDLAGRDLAQRGVEQLLRLDRVAGAAVTDLVEYPGPGASLLGLPEGGLVVGSLLDGPRVPNAARQPRIMPLLRHPPVGRPRPAAERRV